MTTDRDDEMAFKVSGLDCAEEVAALRREVGPLVGGESALRFDILRAKMIVTAGTSATSDEIRSAVRRAGMVAEPWSDAEPPPAAQTFRPQHRRNVLTAASGLFLLFGALLESSHGGLSALLFEGDVSPEARFVYLLSIITGGWTVLPKAWNAARRLRADMNLLMVVAVLGAVAIGEWLEASTVAFLFAVSLTLESWSVGRARRAVQALLSLSPPVARQVSRDGTERLVPPDSLEVGGHFHVRPGERVPLDGRVVEGAGTVDQSPITGEGRPVSKSPGDEVFAGTINLDGALTVESTKPASQTTLSQITRMIAAAQARRSPTERWVERFARVYTPAVMVFALGILVVPPLAFGAPWSPWLYRALVLLVIACPCALVISTPVTIVAALTAAARNGVLIKSGVFVEAPARLRAFAIDKTGTLTTGRPRVTEVIPLAGVPEAALVSTAVALESHGTHPLARAVAAYGTERRIAPPRVEGFTNVPGKGAHGRITGVDYWIGSPRYMADRGLGKSEIKGLIERLTESGKAVAVVGDGERVLGLIVFADDVRPEAKRAITDLRAIGIDRIVMLSGDNRRTAEAVARECGITEVRPELLPEDKVAAVEALVREHGEVAMVGDGVNDAPAMAFASVGLAMGAIGTDAAIESSDIALMADDLSKLPWIIRHSRRTVKTVRRNVTVALGVKAAFVALTLAGHGSMWAAVLADSGATLLVTMNALTLLRIRQ